MQLALTIAAEGCKADIAKPMRGLGSGVFEIALAQRGNAYRAVYAVQLGAAVWVIHAFQKKSTRGMYFHHNSVATRNWPLLSA